MCSSSKASASQNREQYARSMAALAAKAMLQGLPAFSESALLLLKSTRAVTNMTRAPSGMLVPEDRAIYYFGSQSGCHHQQEWNNIDREEEIKLLRQLYQAGRKRNRTTTEQGDEQSKEEHQTKGSEKQQQQTQMGEDTREKSSTTTNTMKSPRTEASQTAQASSAVDKVAPLANHERKLARLGTAHEVPMSKRVKLTIDSNASTTRIRSFTGRCA